MTIGYIYGLAAKSDEIIKYVGLTKTTLNHRLAQHKCEKKK